MRVFHDRAINSKDKNYIQENISTLISQNFGDCTQFAMREPILFGDYRNTLIANEPRLYEDIQDFDASKGLEFEVFLPLVVSNEYPMIALQSYVLN